MNIENDFHLYGLRPVLLVELFEEQLAMEDQCEHDAAKHMKKYIQCGPSQGAEEEGDESDEDTKRKAVKPSQVLHLESHELIVLRRSRIFLES